MPTRTAPPLAIRDEQRDVNTLAWDLTVHQLHQAFARCAFPNPDRAGESERDEDLVRVRMAAVRHAVEDIQAALRRIESGTYGMCQQCGCIIAADRIRARPTTRWCTVCQV
ncbi:TraR/DksA C4-type zinc finger protein [Actinoplanes sp. DH11]|uniref:TraR/DksA family transcriptional regulator n=1 Tax=Actinoplanes sp. DH11 TaxID=2857011 RepID=UPI001E487CC3|nr:TraR/DksA C4-type zinc finger protein [Actinoplanes sp. DH11]